MPLLPPPPRPLRREFGPAAPRTFSGDARTKTSTMHYLVSEKNFEHWEAGKHWEGTETTLCIFPQPLLTDQYFRFFNHFLGPPLRPGVLPGRRPVLPHGLPRGPLPPAYPPAGARIREARGRKGQDPGELAVFLKHTVLVQQNCQNKSCTICIYGLENNIDLLVAVTRWVEICLLNGQ